MAKKELNNDETKYYLEVVFFTVAAETIWRCWICNPFANPGFRPSVLFVGAFVGTTLTIWMGLKRVEFFKSQGIRNSLTFLYSLDGVVSLGLGWGMYTENVTITALSILASCKIFLLHFLSRMVTGVQAYTYMAITLQTTKTFLHHLGSFFYIHDPKVLLLTSVWRFVSLSGHGSPAFRPYLDTKTYDKLEDVLNAARNVVAVCVLLCVLVFPDIRRGFALSAVGHFAYMGVRLGAIFRLGGPYLSKTDAEKWKSITDPERISLLLRGQHPSLGGECAFLLLFSFYLLYLRATTAGIITATCAIV